MVRVAVRHVILLDEEGRDPFEDDSTLGLQPWWSLADPTELVTEFHEVAGTVWRQAGIELHLTSIEVHSVPGAFPYHQGTYDLIGEACWREGVPEILVTWSRKLKDLLYGISVSPRYPREADYIGNVVVGIRLLDYVPFAFVAMAAGWHRRAGNKISPKRLSLRGLAVDQGVILAHELGHYLGLSHIYIDPKDASFVQDWQRNRIRAYLAPFPPDLPAMGTIERELNLMSYVFSPYQTRKVRITDGLGPEDIRLSPSQRKRARLSLATRCCHFWDIQAVNQIPLQTPGGKQIELLSRREISDWLGIQRFPSLPDCLVAGDYRCV